MTLEQLLERVSAQKLRVNNLFQLQDGTWQANLTDGEQFWDFGRGAVPGEALANALVKAAEGPGAKGIVGAQATSLTAEELGL